MLRIQLGGLCLLLVLAACGTQQAPPGGAASGAAAVDGARILAADREPGSWMSYGRTYDEQRFSPLRGINADNVGELKLAWHHDLDAPHRAQESTPVVVDGVMYVTSAFSKVFALDPATGRQLWMFDPKVAMGVGVKGCCDVANRGVAVWNGKVYVGTYDGRLIALDARTGRPVWSVLTVDDSKSYTITGAPRVIKGKVIIGNGGGEFATRGYVSAYDAQTGRQVWRFYTVPGEPGKADGAPSDQVLESKARPTWKGEFWKLGGGGMVWDNMAYDPKLDLLYFGTDNGSPWNQTIRSPGGGDNLFIASIIAVRPDTGEYVWHYQESPGESWDFSAVQHIVLADLSIDGRTRQALMQAPKNGVFYVLDRATGELISAKPYTTVNWATGFDPKTGRPHVDPQAQYGDTGKLFTSQPGASGGHNWQPMAYSPETHLVYIPVIGLSFGYVADKAFRLRNLGWNTGVDFNAGSLPEDPKVLDVIQHSIGGHLSAWDPVAQREVWSRPYPTPWNGGVLATAGNLVFQGTANGELAAYRADNGRRLWSVQTHTGILAPPIAYEVNGEEYIALELGWGGAFGLAAGQLARDSHANTGNVPRVLAFRLNGTDAMPDPSPPVTAALDPPPDQADAATVAEGKAHFHSYCSVCHGDSAVSGGVMPDLRYAQALSQKDLWQRIVHDGVLTDNGMMAFRSELSPSDIETIRAYVIHRAHQTKTP
jgi:PQQ-dependent dehydrogenase (methanol/ethanol family)